MLQSNNSSNNNHLFNFIIFLLIFSIIAALGFILILIFKQPINESYISRFPDKRNLAQNIHSRPIEIITHNKQLSKKRVVPKPKQLISDSLMSDGEMLLPGTGCNIIYYKQNDSRWADKIYGGNDTIGIYGCGPTVLAMVVSSLTEDKIKPDTMANWAYNNGYFCQGSGSYHSLIPEGATSFGLSVTNLNTPTPDVIRQELSTGKIIVALMDEGYFTSGGHFIILRSSTLDGKIMIVDPMSLENSQTPWDIDFILNESKKKANSGGPMWSIGKPYP